MFPESRSYDLVGQRARGLLHQGVEGYTEDGWCDMPDAVTGENIFNKADVDNSTIYITTHVNFINHQREDSRREDGCSADAGRAGHAPDHFLLSTFSLRVFAVDVNEELYAPHEKAASAQAGCRSPRGVRRRRLPIAYCVCLCC